MENVYSTRLKCSNLEVVDAVAKEINFSFGYERCEVIDKAWWPGGVDFYVQSMSRAPHDEVKKISMQFLDDVITCRYSGLDTQFCEVCTVEYKAGQDNVVSFEPSYIHIISGQYKFLDWHSIYDKAEAFFRRLDTTETDKDGRLFLKWFEEEVTYRFKYDATDGKRYRIEATKIDWEIEFNVFEELVENN